MHLFQLTLGGHLQEQLRNNIIIMLFTNNNSDIGNSCEVQISAGYVQISFFSILTNHLNEIRKTVSYKFHNEVTI